MKLYIFRHAQGLHNLHEDYSIYDPALSAEGFKQCERVRESGKYNDIQLVISSTAVRTIQTALGLFPNHQIYATDLLLEYNTGCRCNCRNSLELQKSKFPQVNFEAYKVKPLDKEITWQDGDKRAQRFKQLLTLLGYENIAIVSHCNFLRNLIPMLGAPESPSLDNCQCYEINI